MDRLNTLEQSSPAAEPDTTPAYNFRSPPRILIPKLAHSRDSWKAKAQLRLDHIHTLKVRVYDLNKSRYKHRQQRDAAEQRAQQLAQQVAHLQQQLSDAQQRVEK